MWRPPRKILRDVDHGDFVAELELLLAHVVLLSVMEIAERDGEDVAGLHSLPAISCSTDVSSFDFPEAVFIPHRTLVAAHPLEMGSAPDLRCLSDPHLRWFAATDFHQNGMSSLNSGAGIACADVTAGDDTGVSNPSMGSRSSLPSSIVNSPR